MEEEAPEITRFRCQILMVPLSPLSPPRSLSFSMVQRRRSLAYLDEEDPPPPVPYPLLLPPHRNKFGRGNFRKQRAAAAYFMANRVRF